MQTILEEIYWIYLEKYTKIRDNPNYEKTLRTVCKTQQQLSCKLSQKEKALLTELLDSMDDLRCVAAGEAFADGFALGAALTVETKKRLEEKWA